MIMSLKFGFFRSLIFVFFALNALVSTSQIIEKSGYFLYCEVNKKTTNYFKFVTPVAKIKSFTDLIEMESKFDNVEELVKFTFSQYEKMYIEVCGNKFKAFEYLMCSSDSNDCKKLKESMRKTSFGWIAYSCRTNPNLFDSLLFSRRKAFTFLPVSCHSFSTNSLYGKEFCIVLFYANVRYAIVDFSKIDVRKFPILDISTSVLDTNKWIFKHLNPPQLGNYGLLLNIEPKSPKN